MEVLVGVPELGAPTATAIAAAIVAGAATLMTVVWRASMTHEETTAGLDDEGQRASTAAASSVAVQQARHASPIAASVRATHDRPAPRECPCQRSLACARARRPPLAQRCLGTKGPFKLGGCPRAKHQAL